MKPEIWWAVCWRGEGISTIFSPQGVQVPRLYKSRADARKVATTYQFMLVRKVMIVEMRK